MVKLFLLLHLLPYHWTASLPKPKEIGAVIQQSSNDLAFGSAQVEQFVRDRPDAAAIIRGNSMLRWTLIWNFAGELKRGRIYWCDLEPQYASAEHSPVWYGHPTLIKVSKDQEAVDQCASLLFELFNYKVDLVYEDLRSSDPADRKTRDEFVSCCVRAEFNARLNVQWFFIHHPIHGVDTGPATWYASTVYLDHDFVEHLKHVEATAPGYLQHYEKAYVQILKHSD